MDKNINIVDTNLEVQQEETKERKKRQKKLIVLFAAGGLVLIGVAITLWWRLIQPRPPYTPPAIDISLDGVNNISWEEDGITVRAQIGDTFRVSDNGAISADALSQCEITQQSVRLNDNNTTTVIVADVIRLDGFQITAVGNGVASIDCSNLDAKYDDPGQIIYLTVNGKRE
jgi:hypothetical protein